MNRCRLFPQKVCSQKSVFLSLCMFYHAGKKSLNPHSWGTEKCMLMRIINKCSFRLMHNPMKWHSAHNTSLHVWFMCIKTVTAQTFSVLGWTFCTKLPFFSSLLSSLQLYDQSSLSKQIASALKVGCSSSHFLWSGLQQWFLSLVTLLMLWKLYNQCFNHSRQQDN